MKSFVIRFIEKPKEKIIESDRMRGNPIGYSHYLIGDIEPLHIHPTELDRAVYAGIDYKIIVLDGILGEIDGNPSQCITICRTTQNMSDIPTYSQHIAWLITLNNLEVKQRLTDEETDICFDPTNGMEL